ncbi:hypothetical protein [Alcanivorax sediminis]|uniref:Uncharacterized protein n=1 Tax=Alcanivorax sediminis TaxID=2663008 RepID=A0A6N7LRY4_9GAMM|nr:hypothetical protein [Alcanivorax sediminis]MQX53043.1 hypothetical protein [Alcanivorax sediminis]
MEMRVLVIFGALLSLSSNGVASIHTADLGELELAVWQVRSDFHMLTVMKGDQIYDSSLEDSIARGRKALSRLERGAENGEEQQLITKLRGEWTNFEEAASSNTIVEHGYTDAYTILDVNEIPIVMLEQKAAFEGGVGGNFDDIYGLAAFLQRLSSEYLNLAADPTGGAAIGTDEGRLDFKEAVPQFESMLAAAKERHAGDEAMVRALESVSLKWGFVRQSMINFSENAVPYLVYRYTSQMVDTLDQATKLASTEVEKPTLGPVD